MFITSTASLYPPTASPYPLPVHSHPSTASIRQLPLPCILTFHPFSIFAMARILAVRTVGNGKSLHELRPNSNSMSVLSPSPPSSPPSSSPPSSSPPSPSSLSSQSRPESQSRHAYTVRVFRPPVRRVTKFMPALPVIYEHCELRT